MKTYSLLQEEHLKVTYVLILFSTWIIPGLNAALSGWSSSPTQYHVQNDEGPERFFRYQTFNGQYRKERRMDDGTVVGSYGWVDPTGYLRMTDYIADGKGYRVVKSRMEFVGVKPEESSAEIKPFKPLKHSTRVVRQRNPDTFSTTSSTVNSSTVLSTVLSTVTVPTIRFTVPSDRVSITERPSHKRPRIMDQITRPYPQLRPIKELDLDPVPPKPFPNRKLPLSTVRRPSKRRIVKVVRRPPLRNSTVAETMTPPPPPPTVPPTVNSGLKLTVPAPLDFAGNRPYIIQVTRGDERSGHRNDVFKGYATPLRNGNGFLYKIPNQFHKEETESDGSRVGSFGYVDPFGIRRVIHYNANNTGFAHQVDFKYVGDPQQR